MKRAFGLMYGILCYLFFLGVFLRAIWFVWSMDRVVPVSGVRGALLVDGALLAAFAVQHSGMARQEFKHALTKAIPQLLERSTYVLMASAALFTVVQFWHALPGQVWSIDSAPAVLLLRITFWLGWATVLACTLLIDHFDLFGLKQAWKYFRGERYEAPRFRTPGPYRLVRHPLYLGFLIAFWSAPRMTSGHLFFALMCTGYILVAIQLEERDLVRFHGEEYRRYRQAVSMLLPVARRGKKTARFTDSEVVLEQQRE